MTLTMTATEQTRARHPDEEGFDGRGNGRSDRPGTTEAYRRREFAADALAVLDAAGTGRAVLAGLSRGARWAVELGADRPERVLGAVLIDPAFSEPHSTKQIEDMVGWRLETTPETLILTQLGGQPGSLEEMTAILRRVRCPVLVVHGTEDEQVPAEVGSALAGELGGRLVLLEGAGHAPTRATRSR